MLCIYNFGHIGISVKLCKAHSSSLKHDKCEYKNTYTFMWFYTL